MTILRIKTTTLIICALLILASAKSPDSGTWDFGTEERQTRSDSVNVGRMLERWNSDSIPGFAIAVVKDGETIFEGAYGMADLENDIPLTARSVFPIGSLTKQFTAMSVLLLEEEGKISLDDPLTRYYTDMPEVFRSVTVSHLIYQTSGLSDYLNLILLTGRDAFMDPNVSERMAWQLIRSQEELIFSPGERFQYSNTNYFLLQQLVEKISGMSLPEFAQQNIFEPLGMDQTRYVEDYRQIIEQRARGFTSDSNGFFGNSYLSNSRIMGSGGIYSTVGDLVKWERNFHHNRLGRGQSSLIENLQEAGRLNDGTAITYASGLFRGSYKGTRSFTHGGQSGSYSSSFASYPEKNAVVILLKNNLMQNVDTRAIADGILFGEWPDNVGEGGESGVESKMMRLMNRHSSKDSMDVYTGSYPLTPASLLRIRNTGGHLVAERPIGIEPLLETGQPDFFEGLWSGVRYEFQRNEENRPDRLIQHFPVMSMPALSRWSSPLSLEQTEALAGSYRNRMLRAEYVLEPAGPGELLLTINRSRPVRLYALGEHRFGGNGMVLDFLQDGNGVLGFDLQNHRIRTLRFEKTSR